MKTCIPLPGFSLALVLLAGTVVRADQPLPTGLRFVTGPVNGAVLERDGRCLCVYGDPSNQQLTPDWVLLTHARRDAVWPARELAKRGVKVVAPEAETDSLTRPERFWAEMREKRFHDYAQQSTKVPVPPVAVSRAVKPGETIEWSGLSIRVIDTPGYTRGAVSYLVSLGGQTVAFSGDLIDDPDFGLDEGWAGLHPYWQTMRPGESAKLLLRVTNHSPRERTYRTTARCPEGVRVATTGPVRISPHADGSIPLTVQAAAGAAPGIRVIVADVAWEDGDLREWAEAVVEAVP